MIPDVAEIKDYLKSMVVVFFWFFPLLLLFALGSRFAMILSGQSLFFLPLSCAQIFPGKIIILTDGLVVG